jgi:hypothetical protein
MLRLVVLMMIPLRNSTIDLIIEEVGINKNQIDIINAYQVNSVSKAFKKNEEASFYKLANFNKHNRQVIYKAIQEQLETTDLTSTEIAKEAAKELKLKHKSLRSYRRLSKRTLDKFNNYE